MWERRKGVRTTLTPDGERDAPLKVSVGEGGDVAGVAALVRLLCVGNEQGRVLCGAAALEPHPSRVTPKLWHTKETQYLC